MNEKIKNINFTYLFILSTVSFLWFMFKDHTAYNWPAIDMMPFFERYYDSSFLINDFFTNAISNEPNPRWSFGYFIIGLTELFHTDWYTVSYSLKVILVVFTPILYYLVIYFILGKFIDVDKLKNIQIILLLGILIVIYPRISGIFSIAWWKPYFIQSAPQNLSLAFGLLGIILKEINLKSNYYNFVSLGLFSLSTFIHPAIGLFIICFYVIANYLSIIKKIKFFITLFVIGFLLPVAVIKVFFAPEVSLNTIDFVNIYTIENHSSHYHLENFGTHTPLSWIYSFILMLLLLIVPIVYSYIKKIKTLFILSALFLVSLLLAILCQYIFIDILPSKTMASIGPVRFTQFTYWMIVISWAIMLSGLYFLNKINFNFKLKKIYLVIMGGGYIVMGILMIDSPQTTAYQKDKNMYDFISSTNKESVYTGYVKRLDISNIGQRAILMGNGFPFNESYFKEYQNRKELLFGNREQIDKIKGSWEGDKVAKFFRAKKPIDFVNISNKYRLDYVVIESSYAENFNNYKPSFENKKVKIYKISNFKEKQ